MAIKHIIIAAAVSALGAGAAQAQEPLACADAGGAQVPVVSDSFVQSYAVTRMGANGVEIAVNEERGGVGLGRQTKEWLFERQCVLALGAGANPPVQPNGLVDFSLIQHQEADCEAYKRIVEKYKGQRNALSVIDRDVSAQKRGTYWDPSMGQIRNVSAEYCLSR